MSTNDGIILRILCNGFGSGCVQVDLPGNVSWRFYLIFFPSKLWFQSSADWNICLKKNKNMKFNWKIEHFRWPYDWQTPSGYCVTLFTIIIQYYLNSFVYINSNIIFFGICKFLLALTTEFDQCLEFLNVEINKIERNSMQSKHKLKQMLHGIIQFHADMKQLSDFFLDCQDNIRWKK